MKENKTQNNKEMIVMTREKMIKQIMTREEMIEEMTGERILLDAEWLEENDPEMLDWITDSKYWDMGYEKTPSREKAWVRLEFDEGGVRYIATTEEVDVEQSLNHQIPWGEDSWEDWNDIELIQYYNEMQKDSLRMYKQKDVDSNKSTDNTENDTEKDEDESILGIYINIKEDEEINLCLRS
jgi:hypothetical protein